MSPSWKPGERLGHASARDADQHGGPSAQPDLGATRPGFEISDRAGKPAGEVVYPLVAASAQAAVVVPRRDVPAVNQDVDLGKQPSNARIGGASLEFAQPVAGEAHQGQVALAARDLYHVSQRIRLNHRLAAGKGKTRDIGIRKQICR